MKRRLPSPSRSAAADRGLAHRPLARRPALVAWLLVSLVLFLVSAQVQSAKVSDAADAELGGGGYPLTSPTRSSCSAPTRAPKGSKEPGANKIGQPLPLGLDPAVAHRRRPQRDALDPARHRRQHPRHGQNKINAAYAIGGPSLAIRTVEDYLGIQVNHLSRSTSRTSRS